MLIGESRTHGSIRKSDELKWHGVEIIRVLITVGLGIDKADAANGLNGDGAVPTVPCVVDILFKGKVSGRIKIYI